MRFALLFGVMIGLGGISARAEETYSDIAGAFSWDALLTMSGASAATLLIVQGTKRGVDRLIKLPTALYAYIVAVLLMLLATHYTGNLNGSSVMLSMLNGYVVSSTASHTYDAVLLKVAGKSPKNQS